MLSVSWRSQRPSTSFDLNTILALKTLCDPQLEGANHHLDSHTHGRNLESQKAAEIRRNPTSEISSLLAFHISCQFAWLMKVESFHVFPIFGMCEGQPLNVALEHGWHLPRVRRVQTVARLVAKLGGHLIRI